VLWKFENDKRSSVSWVRNTPTATHQWHDPKVRISVTKVQGYLDDKLYPGTRSRNRYRDASACGRRPTAMYFSDYTVTTAN